MILSSKFQTAFQNLHFAQSTLVLCFSKYSPKLLSPQLLKDLIKMHISQHSISLEMGLINQLRYSLNCYITKRLQNIVVPTRQKFTSFSFNSSVQHRLVNVEKAALFHKAVQGIKLMLSCYSANLWDMALLVWQKLVPDHVHGLSHSHQREGKSKEVEGKQFVRKCRSCAHSIPRKIWPQLVTRQAGNSWLLALLATCPPNTGSGRV